MTVDDVRDQAFEFTSFVAPYQLAIAELTRTFGMFRDELTHPDHGCPIEHVSSRMKSMARIAAKAHRMDCPLTPEWVRRTIHDIAGVRVVCGTISDVYRIAHMLGELATVSVVVVEDYIAKPKPNGYRSLHMTVEVAVLLSDRVETVPVELQFRTRAMDVWASFEHKFCYRNPRVMSQRLIDDLAEAADAAHRLDMAIDRLRASSSQPTSSHGMSSYAMS